MAVAYVDGSFNVRTGQFGYGILFLTGELLPDGSERIIELSKAFYEPELSDMRNIAGEIMGAAQAMKSARNAGIKNLVIYHDYEGIEKWCTGEWKAKKKWTKKYKAFYDEISRDVNVTFRKVEAHSGDLYNNRADRLAKDAVGNP